MPVAGLLKRIIPLIFICGFLFTLCSTDKDACKIRLRWVEAYPGENWGDVKTGIYWSLSYLGASLDSSNVDEIIKEEERGYFTLDLVKAGFDRHALNAFRVIIDSLERTEEYQQYNAVDLARFFVLTEHSAWHYYEITGVARTLNEFYKRHEMKNEKEFHVFRSGVAREERNIRFSGGRSALDMAWIAEEGTGSPDSGTFVRLVFEVFDVMKNGQLRFAIYDANGELIAGSPTALSAAGKPSKCIWCHELAIHPLLFETPEPQKGISVAEFESLVALSQRQLELYRKQLNPVIDFTKPYDHTHGEVLYTGFMEPSAFRLANEWQTGIAKVKAIMQHSSTHSCAEFPLLGDGYPRAIADSLAAYSNAPVPVSVRELFFGEPDYFGKHR
jgi:hypothetical protein